MSIFLNDPRETKDPLLNRSANTRLLIDLLGEGIALSLASATASNYLSDQYGSFHRIIYEKCAQLISELIVDISDLSDDNEMKQLREEFLNLRILSVLFRPDEQLSLSDTNELQRRVNTVLDSINKGSSLQSISTLIQSFSGPSIDARLEITGEHSFDVALTAYNQTSLPYINGVLQESGHRHLLLIRGEGLESTGGPIGASWGEDLHYHQIYNGVVQPAYDANGALHSHEILTGISPSIVSLQQDLERSLKATKPAHVSLGKVTNVTDESIETPEELMLLSLGSSYQEDMRVAREGTYESEILGYSTGNQLRTWVSIFNVPDSLYLRGSLDSFERSKHRVLSKNFEVIPDGTYEITLPRIKSREDGSAITFGASYSVTEGLLELPEVLLADGWVEELAWLEVQDGEMILAGGTCYFARRLRAPEYLDSDGISCNLGALYLEAEIYTLDTLVANEGVKYAQNRDLSYRTRAVRFREFSWTMGAINNVEDPITPSDFPLVLKRSFNAPVTGADFILYVNGTDAEDLVPPGSELVLRWYDLPSPHVRYGLSAYLIDGAGVRSSLVSPSDALRVAYPFGLDQNTTFSALNHPSFKLNAHRFDRIKDSLAGRGRNESNSGNSISAHPQVLNSASRIEVGVYERREVSTSLLRTDTLNTKSVLGSGFLLNKSSISVTIDPSKVYKPAVASAPLSQGKINIADLGFIPDKIISVKQGNVYYSYRLEYGFIHIENAPDEGTVLEVTALSTKPFTSSEEWFRNEEFAEGQVPFISKDFQPYQDVPTPDDYMSNPEGRPLTNASQDESRRYSGAVFTESRGDDGELVFAEDSWANIGLAGDFFSENGGLLVSRPYNRIEEITASDHNTNPMYERIFTEHFICGGENGGVVYNASLLNDLSILHPSGETAQVCVYLIP